MITSPELTSIATSAKLDADINLSKGIVDTASLLWLYANKGSIAGVPVLADSTGLPITNQALLLSAMEPIQQVEIFAGYLSPENKLDIDKYKQIRQQIALGSAVIISLDKQFIQDKNAFMYIVVYCKYSYKLNLRYNFYRLELENGKVETAL